MARRKKAPTDIKATTVTLRDVAREAAVDVSVVSRVVNQRPALRIAEATRVRVEKALRDMGYRPNVQARGLRMAKTWTAGFVLPDLMNPFYAPIVEGAEQRASETGYMLVIVRELDRVQLSADEFSFARLIHQGRVDGLLVASGRVDDAILEGLSTADRPIVIVNRRVPGIAGSVVVDDEAGAYVATQHLIELGHRRLGHIAGPQGIDNTTRRRAGFERAAHEAGATTVIINGDGWEPGSGYRAAKRLLASRQVTGIFATNIMVAAGVVGAAQERGLSVPKDISVIALHDSPVLSFLRPALSTVILPLEQLGRISFEVLLERLRGAPPREIIVETRPQLVRRDSTDRALKGGN